MRLKPCPFCGTELAQENRLNPFAKKYGDFPFVTFYVHPKNDCFLSNESFKSEKVKQWNQRIFEPLVIFGNGTGKQK